MFAFCGRLRSRTAWSYVPILDRCTQGHVESALVKFGDVTPSRTVYGVDHKYCERCRILSHLGVKQAVSTSVYDSTLQERLVRGI